MKEITKGELSDFLKHGFPGFEPFSNDLMLGMSIYKMKHSFKAQTVQITMVLNLRLSDEVLKHFQPLKFIG